MRDTRARGVFVGGTDTGVGKTVVACALVRGLRAMGLDVGAMKPIETGVERAMPRDALALLEAAGAADPVELICPVQLALPAAPVVAAAAEARGDCMAVVRSAFERLARAHTSLVVEGAGGLLVPIDGEIDMAGLALELELPLLLVARASLGTINHTLLSLETAERRGLELAGVVFSHAGGPLSAADAENFAWLRHELGPRVLGEIPALVEGARPDPAAIDLERLRGYFA